MLGGIGFWLVNALSQVSPDEPRQFVEYLADHALHIEAGPISSANTHSVPQCEHALVPCA